MPRVLAVLAGSDDSIGSLAKWAASADIVVAADGGANRAIAAGRIPNVVVGDLDSLDPNHRDAIPELLRIEDQETTDCDKALRLIRERGWPSATLIGLEGDRLDHVLAGLGSVLASDLDVRLVLRGRVARLVRTGQATFATTPGRIVSLIPLPRCVASLFGVRWPLHDADLALGARLSVSNEAAEPIVAVHIREGAALLFLEHGDEEPAEW